jgi:hypothetical protein
MQDSNLSLNTKIASVALAYHLGSKDKTPQIVATTALAMYLNATGGNNKAKIIAQIALAIHLENNPNASFSAPNRFANGVTNSSAWSSKILMMRQLPIRK